MVFSKHLSVTVSESKYYFFEKKKIKLMNTISLYSIGVHEKIEWKDVLKAFPQEMFIYLMTL